MVKSFCHMMFVLFMVSCPVDALAEVRRAWPTMGTYAEVVLDTETSERANEAIEAVRGVFDRVNRTMSVYRKNSDLTRVNRWAGFRSVPVDPWVARVVDHARRAQVITDGAFSPSRLAEGIERGLKPPLVNVVPGDYGPESIAVSHSPPRIRLERSGMGLDLGGIAKGFALDRAGEVLERRGFERSIINLGRSLRVGDPPRGKSGWPVQLADRGDSERVRNTVISTSRQGIRSDTDHVVVANDEENRTERRWIAVAARTGWVSDMVSTALLVDPSLTHRLINQYPSLQWVEIGRLNRQ